MAQVLVALFHDAAQAREAVQELRNAGLPREAVSVTFSDLEGIAQNQDTQKHGGIVGNVGRLVSTLTGFGASSEEATRYHEDVQAGGILVTANTPDNLVDQANAILTRYGAIDFDADTVIGQTEQAQTEQATTQNRGLGTEGEQRFDVVEEQLQVGKQQVQTGGVRIFKTVSEQPVQEQVTVREEHVKVDRRPVDRPANQVTGDDFQEQQLEVTTTAERPVVEKTARVVEEVVVNKDVEERQQTVQDTVRRTDVHVEQTPGQTGTNQQRTNRTQGSSNT